MTNNLYRMIKNNYQIILDRYKELRTNTIKEKLYIDDIKYNKDTKVAIIVPYRDNKIQDRALQLKQFSEYYHNYLDNIDIYIIEQSDDGKKFNRGCLLNCGFELAKKEKQYDMYIFHDVDLISPVELKPVYTYVSPNPIHIASLWTEKYKHTHFFGGITSFSGETYEKINGYPNNFYGWGGEDDAVYNRMIMCNMIVYRLKSNTEIIIKDISQTYTQDFIEMVNLQKKHNLLKDMDHWKTNGLSNLKYNIINNTKLSFNNITKITVEI